MEIGWLHNHDDLLIEIPAARGSRHHPQVELHEPELKLRPGILSSEDYCFNESRQPMVLSSLEERLWGSSLRSRGQFPWWLDALVNESKRGIKNRHMVVGVKRGEAYCLLDSLL